MKTVMQQLIEELNGNSFQELFSNQNYIKDYLENRIKSIYLEAEKQQIIDAWRQGEAHGHNYYEDDYIVENKTEEYYYKTFKSDE